MPRHMAMVGIAFVGLFAAVLALPVSDEVELQILGVFGIVVSGVIALASNSVLANAMAGLNLRLNKPFVTGDHIRVGDHAGRVTERGLFDTEIQTANRELVSLPNAYLVGEPITVISSQGAMVFASIPLDNEVHYSIVEETLLNAAKDVDLIEPFTQVVEISDEAITYRVGGMIEDDSRLMTMRSTLNRAILERLEAAEIELVGPMPVEISRPRPGDRRRGRTAPAPTSDIDKLVYDKAEQAEAREAIKEEIDQLTDDPTQLNVSPDAARDLVSRKLGELDRLESQPAKNPV